MSDSLGSKTFIRDAVGEGESRGTWQRGSAACCLSSQLANNILWIRHNLKTNWNESTLAANSRDEITPAVRFFSLHLRHDDSLQLVAHNLPDSRDFIYFLWQIWQRHCNRLCIYLNRDRLDFFEPFTCWEQLKLTVQGWEASLHMQTAILCSCLWYKEAGQSKGSQSFSHPFYNLVHAISVL